jgi:alpha-galactosidase
MAGGMIPLNRTDGHFMGGCPYLQSEDYPIMKKTTFAYLGASVLCAALTASAQANLTLQNKRLSVCIRSEDGAYEILASGLPHPVLISRVDAEVSQHWIHSSDYPRHETSEAAFEDLLGRGHGLSITFSGLAGKPDLLCILHLYDDEPYGDISVAVRNGTGQSVSLQAIRVVDAVGQPLVDLGATDQDDRVLAESVSEDPTIHIGALAEAPHGLYFGVRNVLLYNLASKQSLLLSALTTDKFLTIARLLVSRDASGAAHIASFTMGSTGTTQAILDRDPIVPSQQVQLSLPVPPGESLSSERVMFAAGPNYLQELEAYGEAIHRLHSYGFPQKAPMGWWSWTAFYAGINAGEVLTNARWLAEHLKSLGYDYLHIDEGYDYARGEYTTPNAAQFPDGMWSVERKICNLGLVPGIWTGPFEVSERSWVYEQHKDWLVRDDHDQPIFIGYVDGHADRLYVLDTTNPGAQAYLRHTYRILTRQWGLRYIKLDFMDYTLVEGRYYRPHTTALEAQRIGLKIIREAVGPDVMLDKDGSEMLNPVGLVDEGRIAPDTGHSFRASKDADPNIAARFYMNRNFFISDPDAFSVSKEVEPQQTWHESKSGLTQNEAQVQIVLAALAGGMYEIGDDLASLGADAERLALVENQEILDMNRLERAAVPLDLMTFRPEDEEPSVFFLREDARQAMLAVFNWSEQPTSHTFTLGDLGVPAAHPFHAYDVLNQDAPIAVEGGTLRIEDQPSRSVRLIKLVDDSIPAGAPEVTAKVPVSASAGTAVRLTAAAADSPVPAIFYHWDFGDGTEATGQSLMHTYTAAGNYTVRLTVQGIEGISTEKRFSITVTGYANTKFDLSNNRRYTDSQVK